ncbi:ECF transporter S component [Arthrobacter gandavensis]|uniref:general stress protein n=1 Tax=Arthrobacter gandavensis TaxID=169960 RepID=UPI00189081B0|nr:general stress protein [Arthrobacter gandavensis]MBF4993744.1 ECF transporter S component [Arthrobacter gandavensis]
MSNLFGASSPRDPGRTLPKGELVGRYTAYLDAQKAVDYLADSKFPVHLVSIVGNELKSVERVTGRLTYPRVAMSSAATGAWFGLFVGLALMLFGGGDSYLSLIPSMALGAIFWLLFGVLAYAFQRGRRDFTSTSQVIATSYDVIVAPEAANEARRLLSQLPMVGQSGHPAPPSGQSPYQPPYQQQPPYTGPAPERPSSWADPYGTRGAGRGDGAPEGSAAASGPEYGSQPAPGQTETGQEQPATPSAASDGTPRGQFPDLPDGRPRYGVRLPAAEQTQPAAQAGPAPDHSPQSGAQQPEAPKTPGTDGTAGGEDIPPSPDNR